MSTPDILPIAATFSKDSRFFAQGFTPTALSHGYGAYVKGNDGRTYLDWIGGLGATILGHWHQEFCYRITQQLQSGIGLSLPHYLEQQVAEKIVNLFGQLVPSWTPTGLGVRFGLSGTDATTMAVRLARAVTGRTTVLSSGYHGWADWSVGLTPPAWGVPEMQHVKDFKWGDRTELVDLACFFNRDTIAAIIVEYPMQEAPEGYCQALAQIAYASGALLILDEVVTWPRFGRGGAAELYGIAPDIICLGKGMGNGIPVSCIVGRRIYFDWFSRSDPCFVSSTGFGNTVSLAAADAVLDLFGENEVAHIWQIGRALMRGLQDLGYKVIGQPPRFLIDFPTLSHKTFFVLGMRDRQILWNRPTLPNTAHTMEHVQRTIKAAGEIKAEMEHTDVEAAMKDRLPMVLFSNR